VRLLSRCDGSAIAIGGWDESCEPDAVIASSAGAPTLRGTPASSRRIPTHRGHRCRDGGRRRRRRPRCGARRSRRSHMARALMMFFIGAALVVAVPRVRITSAAGDRDLSRARAEAVRRAGVRRRGPGALAVTRDARATRAQRLRALELIALAHFIRGDEGAARATFERILDIDPGYQLRDSSDSRRSAASSTRSRSSSSGLRSHRGADLEHAAPTAGSAGKPIEFEARATRGGQRVFELVIATRRRGELTYKVVSASPRGDARWRARDPGPSSKPYVLEYYVEAAMPAVAWLRASPPEHAPGGRPRGGRVRREARPAALVSRRWRGRPRRRCDRNRGRSESRA